MKISSTTLIAFGVAASCTLSAKVQASCTPADQGGANDSSDDVENRNPSCKEYSGSCSLAVEKYFSFLQTGGNFEDILKVFSYGNYCGARRKCQSSKVDLNKDPPTPCNAIDSFCQAHDNCSFSCDCEINFVANLAGAFSSLSTGGDGGTDGFELCDETYYDTTYLLPPFGEIPIPEAILIAAPSCPTVAFCSGEVSPTEALGVAVSFCTTIAAIIENIIN